MNVITTELPGVVVIEPKVFADARGFFVETWQSARYAQAGLPETTVQDNLSRSTSGVLRGLHYQWPHPQSKLVYVLEGEILDVAVDVRRGSPTFGRSVVVPLSSQTMRQLFVPRGFAHGFFVASATALVAYKCDDVYHAASDRGVRWNDPAIGIAWPSGTPNLSAKDAALPLLADVPPELLPSYEPAG